MLKLLYKDKTISQIKDPEGIPSSIAISPDGKFLAINQNISILIYDLNSLISNGSTSSILKPIIIIPTSHNLPISSIIWSPDNQCIASGSNDCSIEIYHLQYGLLHKLTGHTAPVTSIKYNEKGNLLLSCSVDESIKIWDILHGTNLRTINTHNDPVVTIDFNNDSSIFSSGSHDGLVRLYDSGTGNCLRTLTYDKDWKEETGVVPVNKVIFAPNGKYLMVRTLDAQSTINLWDCIVGEVVRTFRIEDGTLPSQDEKLHCGVKFLIGQSQDGIKGVYIVAGFEQGQIYMWDTNDRQIVFHNGGSTHENGPILSVDTFQDIVVTLSSNGIFCIWQVEV
ncbi:hypothetical protein TBLA_0B04390 [Henningerozyma blattae CBS 6284]|uniref:Uncharacterized protein n=1 Tax=Henningerozyma blattae (strain ATCC 34711 / CBS 6284 / DSM 70876 / NBRC 10599 / NRRL Y-10934 / UCD 77-7) TaxID=1071380 RepID=I2GYS4_HENB6|nr:hypothetical protein TBLA_0B04390 [Tetrapisispora blattae CBS 6284]CCH59276.1 hypothetical protein TBLA_0B04390 [Tetrapisispora blattae CBS 6284]